MQRVAVTLRQKQEYSRAERLMLRAIHVKKQILKTEVNEDIAYLYNELAITYQGHDDLDNATKCVKKQLLIFEELKKTNSLEYVLCLSFIGELYRDREMSKEAIEMLLKAIEIHELIIVEEKQGHTSFLPADLERSEIMKLCAEEYIKVGMLKEGIEMARKAMNLQQEFFHGMANATVQETMLLLAETLTVDNQVKEAIKLYTEVLASRINSTDPTKDIYRAIAPLHAQDGNY